MNGPDVIVINKQAWSDAAVATSLAAEALRTACSAAEDAALPTGQSPADLLIASKCEALAEPWRRRNEISTGDILALSDYMETAAQDYQNLTDGHGEILAKVFRGGDNQ